MTRNRTTVAVWIASLYCGAVLAVPPSPESVMYSSPGTYPHGITSDGTNLWVTDYADSSLSCMDPATGSILDTVPLSIGTNRNPRGAAWDGEHIWVASSSRLFKIDPQTGDALMNWSGLDGSQQGVAFDGTNLWVVSRATGNISCVDPVAGVILQQFPSPASSPRGIEYRNGSLWHVDSYQDRIYEISPATGEVRSSFLVSRSGPRGIAWHADRFWLVDKDADGIIGFPMNETDADVRTTAYISRGTVTCSFTNTTDDPYTDTHVYTSLAQSDASTDILSRRFFINDVECTPSGLATDEYGQVSADMGLGTVAPGESVTVAVEYIARLHNWTVNVDSNEVLDLGTVDPGLLALYTRDADMYGIYDPYIISHADAAVGDETNVYTMAHLIHDYVIDELDYVSGTPWDDAATVLQQGYASCSGYAFTMIALCRVKGIPTRFAGGSECRSFETGRTDTLHHRWVEVYIPGYGWVPFDPTHDEWDPEDPDVRWREVGAQQRGLVLRRGGGTNDMGWLYTSYAQHQYGYIANDRSVVWVGLPWTDDGDFDGDGITNGADAFAYDHAASLDTDGDGLPDDWNAGYGVADSSSVPPLVADANDDNDGLTDAEEAIAGTDPADANSTLAIGGLAVTGGNLQLQWPSVSGRIYEVWASDTVDGTSVREYADIAATPPLNTYVTDVPAAQRFYRIRVKEAL